MRITYLLLEHPHFDLLIKHVWVLLDIVACDSSDS